MLNELWMELQSMGVGNVLGVFILLPVMCFVLLLSMIGIAMAIKKYKTQRDDD